MRCQVVRDNNSNTFGLRQPAAALAQQPAVGGNPDAKSIQIHSSRLLWRKRQQSAAVQNGSGGAIRLCRQGADRGVGARCVVVESRQGQNRFNEHG